MDIRKIKKLIDLMIESDLQAIEVKEGDQSIALTRRNPVVAAAVPAMPAPAADVPAAKSPRGAVEKSPMVGVFYAAPSPGEAPFVKVGQTVSAGETLGIIEAMKIMKFECPRGYPEHQAAYGRNQGEQFCAGHGL